ncbi:hypothetical protein K466DRAFT_505448, partial [Polyporus arcularius HHB13444]
YPTVGQISPNVMAIPSSSVEVEELFSRGKQVSTDCRSCLGADTFEELQTLNCHLRVKIGADQ